MATTPHPLPDELSTWIAVCDRALADAVPALEENELRAWARARFGIQADAWHSRVYNSNPVRYVWVVAWGAGLDEFVTHASQRIAMANALRLFDAAKGV